MTVAAPPRTSARERLLAAALERFHRNGALGATLEEIRTDAGVSVGALYHHFADKRELAGALYLETLARFQEGFCAVLDSHAKAPDGVRAAVHHVIDWCTANPVEAKLLFDGQGAADEEALKALNQLFFERTERWYATHVHYGALRPLPPRLLAALWLGPTLGYLRGEPARIEPDAGEVLADAAWRTLAKE